MALRRLYNTTTGTGNPSYLTGLQPGGAGVQVAGISTNPMISAPRVEEVTMEVLDVTAPTLIVGSTPLGTPAPAGKLLVMDYGQSIGGAKWKLASVIQQPVGRGQYGIVTAAGNATEAGPAFGTSSGNESSGSKALVQIDGPVLAFVNTTVNATAISAGMNLASDGAGNLTYAGASPAAGTVLARALGPVLVSVSVPVLTNVYLGGY